MVTSLANAASQPLRLTKPCHRGNSSLTTQRHRSLHPHSRLNTEGQDLQNLLFVIAYGTIGIPQLIYYFHWPEQDYRTRQIRRTTLHRSSARETQSAGTGSPGQSLHTQEPVGNISPIPNQTVSSTLQFSWIHPLARDI
jgi:hypothetical protein